jgi:hypothetical protein
MIDPYPERTEDAKAREDRYGLQGLEEFRSGAHG